MRPATPTIRVVQHRPTRIDAELSAGGRARFSRLDQGDFLAPRPVHAAAGSAGRHLRVALIGINMMLLGGDEVLLDLNLGAGVTLEVIEPSGMVAYNSDGVPSRWRLQADLAEGATLIWEGAPLVVAGGADVLRETRIRLDPGARALVQESVVLGRSGEDGGDLRILSRFTGPDADYLYEDLDLTGSRRGAVGILGTSRAMTSVTAAGWRPGEPAAGSAGARRLELAREGAVLRALSDNAHDAHRQAAGGYHSWRSELAGLSLSHQSQRVHA